MVDVRSGDAKTALVFPSTASTRTTFFDDIEVVGEGGMAEIQSACQGDGVAKALAKEI